MTFYPLLITAFLYLITAFGFFSRGEMALAVAFLCYAVANIGFALV